MDAAELSGMQSEIQSSKSVVLRQGRLYVSSTIDSFAVLVPQEIYFRLPQRGNAFADNTYGMLAAVFCYASAPGRVDFKRIGRTPSHVDELYLPAFNTPEKELLLYSCDVHR